VDDGVPFRADNHHLAGMTLDLSDEEATALAKASAAGAGLCPLSARATSRPAEGCPGQARSTETPARTAATAEARHGAEPWARTAETVRGGRL
jgi:hypothetical protein